MNRLVALVVISCALLTGCATVNPMAINNKSAKVDTTSKSLVLMTIDISRAEKSRYEPKPFVIKFSKLHAQGKDDQQNFRINEDDDSVDEGDHTIYLVRMALAPGQYTLDDIWGNAKAFPFVGMFSVPLFLNLTVKPNSITYVGRVVATLRPRQGDEFSAGGLFPLIDQSVTGLSTGTWDVAIDDMSQKDITLFRSNYPVLTGVSIENTLLPPFDRAAVQRLLVGTANK
ncbi:MAG: hypothetical protein M0Z83_04695 [Betaproteobacteria bacterium]|nr:hypothetical protein [Betaproteobacteria bacterium]